MTVATGRGVVAWADTDASGRFHHTAAHRWAENAEHAMYRTVLTGVDIGRFPRRATEASYVQPLLAGDEYTVELDVERVGTTSVTYGWRVLGPAGTSVTGRHTVVHVDDSGRPAPLPPALTDHLRPPFPTRGGSR